MMTIREYFDALYTAASLDDFDDVAEFETTMYRCYEEDFDDFTMWAAETGIDLAAEEDGELVLTLWVWDMCGD